MNNKLPNFKGDGNLPKGVYKLALSDIKEVFNYTTAKILFNADIFWIKLSIGEEIIRLMLDTFQVTKEKNKRGIIEVILNDK